MNILITGCSSGIGNYVAHKLHKNGYNIFATARYKKDVDRLKENGLNAMLMDINNNTQIEECLSTIGKIDVVFNNAAYGQPGALEDLSKKALKEQFETNVFGTHEVTRQCVAIMRKQGYGKIINNSSVLGIVSMKYRGAYNASKYALEGLSDTLRLELEGSGISVSLIEPGPITSKFRENAAKKFKQNIDINLSHHKNEYEKMVLRFQNLDKKDPFTLETSAVYEKIIKILNSKNPKPRYYVTFPTYLFGFLKRILSTRLLDKILKRI